MGDVDARMVATIDLIRRTGCAEFELRSIDDPPPTLWVASARYPDATHSVIQLGAGLDPLLAVFRLAAEVIDGGECTHCHRPAGFDELGGALPLAKLVCWYTYDADTATYRAGCGQ